MMVYTLVATGRRRGELIPLGSTSLPPTELPYVEAPPLPRDGEGGAGAGVGEVAWLYRVYTVWRGDPLDPVQQERAIVVMPGEPTRWLPHFRPVGADPPPTEGRGA